MAKPRPFVGAMFIVTGETARGRALVERAIESTPKAPSGYHASSAVAALREERFDDALAAALRIDSPDWAIGQLVLAATAALAGRTDLAARARSRMLELDPNVEKSLPEVLRRWRVEPVLAEQLQRGLAAAGGSEVGAETDHFRFALLRGKLVDQGLHLGRELLKPCRRCLREPDEVAELLQAVGLAGFRSPSRPSWP